MSDPHHIYYNRRGEPITFEQQMEEWKQSDFDWDKMKRVARQEQDDIVVSTVFLELNHQYGDGPPLLFETMIFGGEHDEEQWQYATEAEALQGHEVAVTLAFGPGHRMNALQRWWYNTNYDRGTMDKFYRARPEWSDLPPEVVATSFAFQAFAFGEAVRQLGRDIRDTLTGDTE